jgi:hypothetical protein
MAGECSQRDDARVLNHLIGGIEAATRIFLVEEAGPTTRFYSDQRGLTRPFPPAIGNFGVKPESNDWRVAGGLLQQAGGL